MTEAEVELAALEWFQSLTFNLRTGTDIDDAGERADLTRVLLEGRLFAALHRLDPQIPHDEVEQVVRTLSRPPHSTPVQNNRCFHEQLTGGVEVSYRDAATGAPGRAGRVAESGSQRRPRAPPARGQAVAGEPAGSGACAVEARSASRG